MRLNRASCPKSVLRFSYWHSPVRNASPVKKVSDAARDRDSGQVGCRDGTERLAMLRMSEILDRKVAGMVQSC